MLMLARARGLERSRTRRNMSARSSFFCRRQTTRVTVARRHHRRHRHRRGRRLVHQTQKLTIENAENTRAKAAAKIE